MSVVKATDTPRSHIVYIPHHAVIRDSSSTIRLRVVFNASHPTDSGCLLNDLLHVGPRLQPDLVAILLCWRQFRYVYTSDITKMYRQILIDTRDVDYQRILWKPFDALAPQEYRLLMVTYGTACAPYLALRVLQHLAETDGASFPLAQAVLQQNIYVDDCLFGADDLPIARQTRDQLISLLNRAGFQLRKWTSNSLDLTCDFDAQNHDSEHLKRLELNESFKVLGLEWCPSTDTFQFQAYLLVSLPNTKRTIRSAIAKLFEPLGWLAPVVITAKILMQRLWLDKIAWDDPLSSAAMSQWTSYYHSLSALNNVTIPRWTGTGHDTQRYELHGFSDASSVAYADVLYVKISSCVGDRKVTLLMSKTRVAPLKPISIPRLELSAAVLLDKMMSYAQESLSLSCVPCYCWTDSTVALAWIRQYLSCWKSFVANRVSEIHAKLHQAHWHYVLTNANPADCASRGTSPARLLEDRLWWQAPPSWLQRSPEHWPDEPSFPSTEASVEERLSIATHLVHASLQWDSALWFSSWPKLLRVTAYVLRFVQARRRSETGLTVAGGGSESSGVWDSEEIVQARCYWLRNIQQELLVSSKV